MKNFILICISVALFISCGICRKFTSDDKSSKKENTKTEKSESVTEEGKSKTEEKKSNAGTEVSMLEFDKSNLPSEINYTGSIVTGKRWTDKNGENILILTKTKVKEKKVKQYGTEDNILECELFGYQYVSTGGSYTLLWKINDLVK